MLLDPADLVPRTILETGAWEPESVLAIKEHLQTGDTFVDVGAHIGYYSLKMARVVGPNGHVIAIEPNARTVRQLQDNIRESGAKTITVQPVACSDAEGSIELFVAPRANTGETSLSRKNASKEGSSVESYRVRARPLDAIIRESGVSRVDVIKIDVEGAELLVLKGARETLTRYHPLLIVELVEDQLKAMGASSLEIISLLRSIGYEPRHRLGQNVEFASRNSPSAPHAAPSLAR
jgi:FkbM family methyltransferase